MTEFRPVDPAEVPSGHTHGIQSDADPPAGVPENVSVVMPVSWGPASIPDALRETCSRCGQAVWRSPRAPDMYRLCFDCAEELSPGILRLLFG